MTIDDQIKDKKLQYDINREATKISSLSSGKIYKYEYLTGKDILPSNQEQIIEQAKFTCSLLGKALEKQIKTIDDQGEKQIKAIHNQGRFKTIKKYASDDEDSPWISKQKEIFNELADKRLNEINELDKKVNLDDLIYRYKGNTRNNKFNKYDNALDLINKIRNGKIKLADAKNNQNEFKMYLGEIKKDQKILKEQKNTVYNIELLYKARKEDIKFFDDYSLMLSEAKNKAKNNTNSKVLKILTPKQMLQRLPIALALVQAGINSQN